MTEIVVLPDGTLVVAGQFGSIGGVAVDNIARWDGTAWSAYGSGTNGRVQSLTQLPNGDLLVGGSFTIVDGIGSPFLATLTTTCPATAVAYGTGCSLGAGPMNLTAAALPWAGTHFRATTTGMSGASLGFGILGFVAQATPLSLLHPAGSVGCDLLTNPDASSLLIPAGGSATMVFGMPADPVFVGVVVHGQILQALLDPQFQIVGVGSSNGLRLTLGMF